MNIGVFDTGAGGQLVADRLQEVLPPEFNFIVVNDLQNAPYGKRPDWEIYNMTDRAIQPLLEVTDIIVIACNTATVVAIDKLRDKYSDVNFIGLEPMIKPATALSSNKHITLLATEATKRNYRTSRLISNYASDTIIDMPDTSDWAELIDSQNAESILFDDIAESVEHGSDVIVLGCTHYLILEEKLRKQFPGRHILEPSQSIAKQILQVANSMTTDAN